MMYAGIGDEGLGLANEETSDNVFAALAEPVHGRGARPAAVPRRARLRAASLQTTFIPAARTMLAMGAYRAIPDRFAQIHPAHLIPSYATLVSGVGTGVFYTVLTFVSENVLVDTILSLGIMICFYYGLTAFAASGTSAASCSPARASARVQVRLPLLGGLMLAGGVRQSR